MEKDLIIRKRIGLRKLYIHKSHKLPTYLKEYPFYDRALPRICNAIKEIDKTLRLIDIGANIGDTLALISDEVTGEFLCIEGDKKYLPILKKNIDYLKIKNVTIEPVYCGDTLKHKNKLVVKNENGTARIEVSKKSPTENIITQTLDQIIERNPNFKKCNILKIDTDGFEGNILRGGVNFLKKCKPILFFEFTPKLYRNLKQNPLKILEYLVDLRYDTALFYDNYGRPKKVISLRDKVTINELINKIDEHNIYYYDILAFNIDKPKYNSIIITELLRFSEAAATLVDQQKVKILYRDSELTQIREKNNILETEKVELNLKLTTLEAQLKSFKSWIKELYNTKSWKLITLARSIRSKITDAIKILEKK